MQRCEAEAASSEIVETMALISAVRKITCANKPSRVALHGAKLGAADHPYEGVPPQSWAWGSL
jgi:hypothetical protein